jgi:probable F420-dependent oxidoreductase
MMGPMKVRIGVAVGRGLTSPEELGPVVDSLDALGFDSLWIPETFLAGTLDPIVGLGYAAARVRRLKLGAHLVTPGRNTYSLAKSLAQLDRLSGGRLLITAVAGLNDDRERRAQGMPTGDRTACFDTQIPMLRAWWAGEEVDGLVLDTRPRQDPLELWLGGQAPKALERIGRLADGWLPGAISVAEAVAGRRVIEEAADRHGRAISPEHYGINLVYTLGPEALPMPALPRGSGDPAEVTAVGRDALRALIGRWVDAGFSKIVVRPMAPPASWPDELAGLAEAISGLQT